MGSEKAGIPIGISARHIHLKQEDADVLFGKGYQLTPKKMLIAGEYASEDTVTIASGKMRVIEGVRILGPYRSTSQVEIAGTDAVKLGLKPVYRQSGDIAGSAPITIIGPKGALNLSEGCIVAMAHIHMGPSDAEQYGVVDKDKVDVRFSGERTGTLEDVLVRVRDDFELQMHVDTDEANALALTNTSVGELIKK